MSTTTLSGYSFIAPMYDKIFLRPLAEGHKEIGSLLKRSRPKGRQLKVLEVGVGSGLTLPHVPVGVDFTGIDVNDKMLAVAERKSNILKTRKISLHQMNAERMQFTPNMFDLVIAPSVLSAMDRPMKGLQEIVRVTKRGGKIAIIVNLKKEGTLKSKFMKALDPVTRKLLGFRLDLTLNDFKKFKNLKVLEVKDVNSFMGQSLSTYLLFEKV
jgi:phosphatidylethanolamine/phosphatidyl-N-methylethanolamine N-methyltransferase